MATANLKNLFGGGGGSFTLKAGQSFSTNIGLGGVITGSINVSSPVNVINLTGRWVITSIEIVCSSPGSGTMTATLSIDGVNVLSGASTGTAQNIPFFGAVVQLTSGGPFVGQPPPLVCNSSFVLTLQRSTADTIQLRYIAMAID